MWDWKKYFSIIQSRFKHFRKRNSRKTTKNTPNLWDWKRKIFEKRKFHNSTLKPSFELTQTCDKLSLKVPKIVLALKKQISTNLFPVETSNRPISISLNIFLFSSEEEIYETLLRDTLDSVCVQNWKAKVPQPSSNESPRLINISRN